MNILVNVLMVIKKIIKLLCFRKYHEDFIGFNAINIEKDIHPFLQPIFSVSRSKMIGCEVLVRLRTNDGLVSPGAYIEELERSELLNRVTEKLLGDVTDFFSDDNLTLPGGFYISFNICASQLSSQYMINSLLAFNRKLCGKASMVLELVERGTLNFDEPTTKALTRLYNEGIFMAIDDFGAGSSSMKYIANVCFSTIKIDKELTSLLDNKLAYQRTIEAIVIFSSKLGLSVTAEGVESSLQLKLLSNIGVDAAQGYYLAKPMGFSEFYTQYLHKNLNL